MTNLYGCRTKEPTVMFGAPDRIGPDNDEWLVKMARGATLNVAAWGTWGALFDRGAHVRKLLADCDLHYLRLTKDGHPGHPLYLPKTLTPQRWAA